MSIRMTGYHFSAPVQVRLWEPPYRAGVYAILKPDPKCVPEPFKPLFFGQSGNMSERGFWLCHFALKCWLREAGGEDDLFISIHSMPDSTEASRMAVVQELVAAYDPPCNRPPADAPPPEGQRPA